MNNLPPQDESNRSGGKWIIRLRKGLASRFWENIILAMLGEQFMVGEEICGAVVSIRFQVLQYCSTTTIKLKKYCSNTVAVHGGRGDLCSCGLHTADMFYTTTAG